MIEIFDAQCRVYNPYTNGDLSIKDWQLLIRDPRLKELIDATAIKQMYYSKRISKETIEKLKDMVNGFLNKDEGEAGRYTKIPIAQTIYEDIMIYFQELNKQEREALNEIWIDGWKNIEVHGGFVEGMKTIQFKDLLESMNRSCIHSVAGSVIKLIYQIDPNTEFEYHSEIQMSMIRALK